jgi:hypothetical protein
MGGYGSGRRSSPNRKITVEESLPLRLRKIQREGVLLPFVTDDWLWTLCDGSKLRLKFSVDEYMEGLTLHSQPYFFQGVDFPTQYVSIVEARIHYNRFQYYFLCPHCNRRCEILYLPPGARRFLCRQCHRLTYRSCQRSHQFERLIARTYKLLGRTPPVLPDILKNMRI